MPIYLSSTHSHMNVPLDDCNNLTFHLIMNKCMIFIDPYSILDFCSGRMHFYYKTADAV